MSNEQADSDLNQFNADAKYFRVEWEMFVADQGRALALLHAARSVSVSRVLDIGCGSGQEMLPFVEGGAHGFGMDINPAAGTTGREMFEQEKLSERVNFIVGSGAKLPFPDKSFEVLICRVALMYMNQELAFDEMSRVMRPGSILFLKYHSPFYYFQKLVDGLRYGYFNSAIHASRVICAGLIYQFTGKQSFGRLTAGGEIFQTRRTIRRELNKVRLKYLSEMPDSNHQTPSFVIVKE